MSGWTRFALLAALAILSVPAARAGLYSVRVPRAARVETRVSHTAGWDVSIRFNPRTCQVFCEYRRKSGGWGLFLPPVVEIRAYIDGATRPVFATIDPAGARLPRLAPKPLLELHRILLAPRMALIIPDLTVDSSARSHPPATPAHAAPFFNPAAPSPLRI